MLLLETITLRTTPFSLGEAVSGIRSWLTETTQLDIGLRVEMFHRSPITGDFLIMLHRQESDSGDFSRLGLMIVKYMEQYGTVQHSLWISEADPAAPQKTIADQ